MIEIARIDKTRDPELEAFLDDPKMSNRGALGYHYPCYRDILEAAGIGEPFYLGAWIDGDLAGFLPGFMKRSPKGTVYNSLPFFGPNAGVLCRAGGLEERVHEALLENLLERLGAETDLLSASIYTPLFFERFDLYERCLPGAVAIERVTQYLPIESPSWPAKVAYDVRRAKRLGVSVTKTVNADRRERIRELYERNCREAGIPMKPPSVVDALCGLSTTSPRVHVYSAEFEERLVAALMVLWGPETVSYYLPCSQVESRALQAGTLLVDAAAREASSRGLRFWNWERSPSRDSGVYRFKARWGSSESRYRLYLKTFAEDSVFQDLGREGLQSAFPYFFVYPFDRLDRTPPVALQ